MSSESPWRTLAERLGMLPKNHRPGDPALILLGNKWAEPDENADAQDLLIGRALRVAWAAYVKNGGDLDKTSVLDVFWESSRSGYRAIAALELLDAVGYEHADT